MIFSENIYQMYIEILGKVDCSAFLFTHMIPVLNKRNVLKIQNSPIHTLHSNKTDKTDPSTYICFHEFHARSTILKIKIVIKGLFRKCNHKGRYFLSLKVLNFGFK